MSNFVDWMVTFLASFWLWIMYLGLVILWFKGKFLKKSQIFHIFIISLAVWGIASMIKDLFPLSLRPFQINGYPPLTLTIPKDSAFPSAHSAVAFSVAVSMFLYNKKLGVLYLLGALLVCVGRILGNVHYPIDVVGGATLGTFVTLISENIAIGKLLKRN